MLQTHEPFHDIANPPYRSGEKLKHYRLSRSGMPHCFIAEVLQIGQRLHGATFKFISSCRPTISIKRFADSVIGYYGHRNSISRKVAKNTLNLRSVFHWWVKSLSQVNSIAFALCAGMRLSLGTSAASPARFHQNLCVRSPVIRTKRDGVSESSSPYALCLHGLYLIVGP